MPKEMKTTRLQRFMHDRNNHVFEREILLALVRHRRLKGLGWRTITDEMKTMQPRKVLAALEGTING